MEASGSSDATEGQIEETTSGDGGSDTARSLASEGRVGDGGSDPAQLLASRKGGGEGGSDTAQSPIAGAGEGGNNSLNGAGTGAEAAAADGITSGNPADAPRAEVLSSPRLGWGSGTTTVVHGTTWRSEITYSNAPGSSSSQHHSSGSHGIRYPRPDAAQRLASDGDGDRGSDRAQPLATEGGGDGGSGTAQPLASAGSSTRRAGRKQLQMSDFFRA